jgi:hypothetical protein
MNKVWQSLDVSQELLQYLHQILVTLNRKFVLAEEETFTNLINIFTAKKLLVPKCFLYFVNYFASTYLIKYKSLQYTVISLKMHLPFNSKTHKIHHSKFIPDIFNSKK